MKHRRWKKREGHRVYSYDAPKCQAFIFCASGMQMWAWGVWGEGNFCSEGIAFSLKSARGRANAEIDKVEGKA
jgi:hypothetical protein